MWNKIALLKFGKHKKYLKTRHAKLIFFFWWWWSASSGGRRHQFTCGVWAESLKVERERDNAHFFSRHIRYSRSSKHQGKSALSRRQARPAPNSTTVFCFSLRLIRSHVERLTSTSSSYQKDLLQHICLFLYTTTVQCFFAAHTPWLSHLCPLTCCSSCWPSCPDSPVSPVFLNTVVDFGVTLGMPRNSSSSSSSLATSKSS